MTEEKPIGLGLIGCGAFGLFCLDAYKEMPQVRIAAVADMRGEVADAFGRDFNVPAYHKPEELIGDESVGLVHVATPPASHHELVMKALAAGKHVLCEKPLAMTVAEGEQMLDAARRAERICPVNFVLRYNPVTDAVKAVLDSGVLGACLSARLTNCAQDTNLVPEHWFWDREKSGGIFVEHGVHFFDL